MSRNIKLEIEYDGSNYAGWQIQRKAQDAKRKTNTIQETIERVLRRILQEKVQLFVSGRTDAGVHALAQVANFRTNSQISPERLQLALNGNLPHDIVITKIKDVPLDFNSRFSAKSKIYRYTILSRSHHSPLIRNTVYFCHYPLDISLMLKEVKCLLGKHDFKAFCASGSKVKDTVRTITGINITKKRTAQGAGRITLIVIDIEADGFLYNMVRNIIGTLIDIGRGRLPLDSLKKILKSKNRRLAGQIAPAKGLCLLKVKY